MHINQLDIGGEDRIVRPEAVRARLGISRAKFADMIARGHFPRPFTIIPGGRAVGWLESVVTAWIADRSAQGEAAE